MQRYERSANRFWTVILYLMAALYTYIVVAERPSLPGEWGGLVVAALLLVYFTAFHLLFMRGPWPHSPRRVALYGIVQFGVVLLLLPFHYNYAGLAIPVIAHLVADLPPRRWFWPVAGGLLIIYTGWDVWGAIERGDGIGAFWIVLQPIMWIAVFASLQLLDQKSTQLTATVGELRRAKAELEVKAAQTEELAALRERTRLAREMHDSLGHALVVVNVKLEAAQRLYAKDAARGAAELETTRGLVRDTMAELRRSLENLRAPLPDHQNLPDALRRLAGDIMARVQLDVRCSIAGDVDGLGTETTEALWRVAREALTNVERHAAAASALLSLERRNGTLVLRVADDGSGIKPADLQRPSHFGVVGMRERVEALGGVLVVSAPPGGGTVVEAQVPLEEAR